jgi:FtsP/CotA-like multicopper oxidase with cupredoxin domain
MWSFMAAKSETHVETAVKPPRKWLSRTVVFLLVGVVVIILALSLGLGLGLGLKKTDTSNGSLESTQPPISWRRDPQDYVLSSSFDTNAPNTTRTYTLNLTEIPDGAPDGVSVRMLLVNGQFPGPVIEANEGDRLVVHVNNFMTIPSAIHWHGQYQNGNSPRSPE